MRSLRPLASLLGIGLVACAAPAESGGKTEARCAADTEAADLFAVDTPTPLGGLPLVRAVTDADGVAAVWYDETHGLSFRRWDEHGAALSSATSIAPAVDLPGGETAMSALAIGYGAGVYLVAHPGPGAHALSALRVTPDGQAKTAARPQNPGTNEEQDMPRVTGRDDALFLQWAATDPQTRDSRVAVQAYDARGELASELAAPPQSEGGDADVAVANGHITIAHYNPSRSDVMLRQASVGNGRGNTWTSSTLALPRPAEGPSMRRADAALLTMDDHTFFVDRVTWSEGSRIEIAEIDASGALIKDHSIDLPNDRVEIGNPAIAREDSRVYVAWIDMVATGAATFRVWMFDRDTGVTRTTSAPLSLGKGKGFIHGPRPMGGIRVKGGVIRTSYTWLSMGGERPTRHLGLRTICVAEP